MVKKLLVLAAGAALCINSQAKEVVDGYIDFSTQTELKIYGWGAPGNTTIKDGCLYYQSDAETENPWDVQYAPLGDMDIVGGKTYIVSMELKGSPEGAIFNWAFGGVDHYYGLNYTEDFQVVELEVDATQDDTRVWLQHGNIVGELWIKWIKVTHDEKESSRPEEWVNILVNGDAEGEYGDVPCAYSKEYQVNNNDPHVAEIETIDGNNVFVCHAKAVNPSENPDLVWAEDGEQWGVKHSAGDPKPDCAWQNQFWIMSPQKWAEGEMYRVSFKYKASKAVNTNVQSHANPGEYLAAGFPDIKFSTDWQTFEKVVTVAADQKNMQSIAFNLGAEVYNVDIDFYFDDIKWETLKLDEGYFIVGDFMNANVKEIDLNEAIEMEYDADEEVYVAVVGTVDLPASQIKISTKRGNDRAFNNNCLNIVPFAETDDLDDSVIKDYEGTSAKWYQLPVAGTWEVKVDEDYHTVEFNKVDSSGIVDFGVDNNATPVYYNLQGVKVNNPNNGIFIVKKGNQITKQVIR